MLERITEEELEFCETLCDSTALAECLFDDFDNLRIFNENFSHVRLGQLSMLSCEYMIDEDSKLDKKENFKLKVKAGSLYNFGARKYGKTLITLILDMLMSIIHLDSWKCLFSSFDAVHIRTILEKIIIAAENHPFLRIFNVSVKRSPTYFLTWDNGFTIESINMNIASRNPGAQFFGKHAMKHWMEEGSKETETVFEKRVDAISELGCVERFSGMTDFIKYSPVGRIFGDLEKKPWICNAPQYINPMWGKKEKEEAVKKYGGENSVGYRVFVKGEVVEEGISVFDMERVRKSYSEEKQIKHLELAKEFFDNYSNILIVERPPNAENIYLNADIGESAPTKITIFSQVGNTYKYLYKITLYNLTDKEQLKIFKYLIERIKANFIALDTTEGTGRAIFRGLAEFIPKEHLCWVSFNEKIPVDFERDEHNNIVYKDGKPIYKEEYISEWSIKRLQFLLYEGRIESPIDYELDTQLNSVVSMQSGNRTLYDCISEENHLLQSFQVFAISQWNNEFIIVKPITVKQFAKRGIIE